MSSSLPSPSNDYEAPAGMRLNEAAWNAAMLSIGQRLRERESLEATFQGLIDTGTGQALEVIAANVAPQLATLQATLATLQTEVSAAQDVVAAINSGSIPASVVAETAARIWLTPALRDAWNDKAEPGWVSAQITAAVSSLLGGATPATLDTLSEIAAALGNDANLAATMTAGLTARLRVDAAQGLTAGQQAQGRDNLGAQKNLGFTPVQQSGGTDQTTNKVYVGWSAIGLKAQVDATDLGLVWTDNSSQRNLGASGYQKLPSGLILQWGQYTGSVSDGSITFPVTFPTECVSTTATIANPAYTDSNKTYSICVSGVTASGFNFVKRYIAPASVLISTENFYWFALGH